jgi:alpha-glucosidase (family GH31 glycosyl hydrolase)
MELIVKNSKQNSVFAVVCNQTAQYLTSNKFFFTKEGARQCLKTMAEERKYKMGVDCWKQDEDSFSFILGWEEAQVSFRIVELPVGE